MKRILSLLFISLLYSCSSTPDVVDAGNEYLSSLSEEEKAIGVLKYDDKKRHNWHFFPLKTRKGFMIKDMSEEQQDLAMDVVSEVLSCLGFERAVAVMELESILKALENNSEKRDSKKYYLTIFGEPGQGRWGISYEGHHLSLNFVMDGDNIISSTPLFYGINPAIVIENKDVGPDKGTRLLADQEDKAFELINALSEDQKKVAVVSDDDPPAMKGYNANPGPRQKIGLSVKSFTPAQKKLLTELLETFTENAEENFAAESNYEFQLELNEMYFAWYGDTQSVDKKHSFRIEGPETYIIFHNFQQDSLKNDANHVHSLWRNRIKDFGYNIK